MSLSDFLFPDEAGLARREFRKGNYGEAGRLFEEAEKFKDAGNAYLNGAKRDESEVGSANFYSRAARAFIKCGHHNSAIKAYVEAFKTFRLEEGDIKQIKSYGLWGDFCDKLIASIPPFLPNENDMKKLGDPKLTARSLLRAAPAIEDKLKAWYTFKNALEWCHKAGLSDTDVEPSIIRELCEQVYLTSDHSSLPSGVIEWLWQNGELSAFVRSIMRDHPGFLWDELTDFLENYKESETPEVYEECAELLVEIQECAEREKLPLEFGIRACTYRSVADYFARIGKYDRAASYYIKQLSYSDHGYSEKAAECYQKAKQPLKAVSILEKLGKYKEAAELAEDAGNIELAIRLYKQALKKKGISDTEAEWIKMTVKRLRKEEDKPSATKPAQPIDYKKIIPAKPTETTVQRESSRTCPQFSAETADEVLCSSEFYKDDSKKALEKQKDTKSERKKDHQKKPPQHFIPGRILVMLTL